eukprot:363920-Chlamydomonas_euryale.AAC.16
MSWITQIPNAPTPPVGRAPQQQATHEWPAGVSQGLPTARAAGLAGPAGPGHRRERRRQRRRNRQRSKR